jgi:exodeoxyribonuclease X
MNDPVRPREPGPALIFDTETTGRGEGRQVIEVGYFRPERIEDLGGPSDLIPMPLIELGDRPGDEWFTRRYKPSIPIEFGAMATHHILPSELEGCEPTGTFALPAGVEYLAGQSIDFDWEAIGKPPVKRICTYAIAQHLFDGADSFSLSAMLYKVRGATPYTRELLRDAHSAAADVRNCALLLQAIIETKGITTWSELYALSEASRIPLRMPIGEKQGLKGLTLDEVVQTDVSFMYWALRQDWLDDYLRLGIEQAIDRAERAGQESQPATAEALASGDDIPF